MKYLLLSVSCLLLGYFSYPTFNPDIPSEKKEKFQTFLTKEAKVFAETEDAEAKLKAAEELYGRMMTLFLAELGLKSTFQFKKPVQKIPLLANEGPCFLPEGKAEELPPQVSNRGQVSGPSPKEKKKVLSKEEEAWVKFATSVYLDSFKGKEKRLLGRLEGRLTHEAPPHSGRVDVVIMEFNLYQEEKGLSGETAVVMIDPEGKEYSRNAGTGGNRVLKRISDDLDSYYVEASPTSYFKINLKNFPDVMGQYFEKQKFIGNVRLQKVGP